MIYGIDVSDAQQGIDIVSVKQQNPDLAFCGVKAVGSGGYVNPDCDRVVQQCLSIGLPCFVYGFTRDTMGPPPSSPQTFADWIYGQISGYRGKVGYATDWESVVQNDPLIYQNPAYAAALQNAMAAHWGTPVGFYADYGVLTSGANWGLVAATNSWKWRASYVYGDQTFAGFGTPDWSLLASTPSWPDSPALWQYTSHGTLKGWNGWLDFSAFDGDEAGLRRLLGIGESTTPAQEGDLMFLARIGNDPKIYISNGTWFRYIAEPATIDLYVKLGVVPNSTVTSVPDIDALGVPADYVTSPQFKADFRTGTSDVEVAARIAEHKELLQTPIPREGVDPTKFASPNTSVWAVSANFDAMGAGIGAEVKAAAAPALTDAQLQTIADDVTAKLPSTLSAAEVQEIVDGLMTSVKNQWNK